MPKPIDYTDREKHADTMDALLRMIADLRTTIVAGEPIGTVQRRELLATISSARDELSRCQTKFSDMLKHIRDDYWPSHQELCSWLNHLSIDLKLQILATNVQPRPIDEARLDEGERLTNALSACREPLKFYR